MSRLLRFSIIFFLTEFSQVIAQTNPTQILKGRIIDAQSEYQLIGATVLLWDYVAGEPLIGGDGQMTGSTTDENGNFVIRNVPIGRYTLKISYIGYKDRFVENILLMVAKETIVNVVLEESVIFGQEIVVMADKTEALNEMAMISSRQFTIEETSRYAGSRNDPARMAANYAGVSGNNDARNDIIIRGNSPTGLLWKMDGLPIGNPNHFGTLGSTGGPVNMLNNNVLSNSDFLTGAFPAEFGNANAGVFDLQMRNGNSDRREYLGQIGFNGFELGAEGPFSEKNQSSYLVNYRYSTLSIFQKLGMDFGTGVAVPEYQDMSYKVTIPTKKSGRFSAFGILGTSAIEFLDSEADTTKSDDKDLYSQDGYDSRSNFDNYTFGFNHLLFINSETYFKTGVSIAGNNNVFSSDSLGYSIVGIDTTNVIDRENIHAVFESKNKENRTVVNLSYNQKINARNTFLLGTYQHIISFNYNEQALDQDQNWVDIRKFSDASLISEYFAQWLHKFSDQFSLNTGLHYQRFSLNGSAILEPRVGMKYKFGKAQAINMGYGLHGQVLPLAVYTVQTEVLQGNYFRTNQSLEMTKSHHFIVGYEHALGQDWRMKLETYYQHLYDVPVTETSSSFSMLNHGADFGFPDTDSLVNKGTGKNYGVELTIEKFLSGGFYTLFTTSLFNSVYSGSDNVERSTAYNNNYVVNLLAGKEFQLKPRLTLAFDVKMTLAGGLPYSPIDLIESREQGTTIRDDDRAFAMRYSNYFRADVKAFLRKQGKRATQEWGLEIQNISNQKNIYAEQYSRTQNKVDKINQIGFFPVPQYRILF